MAIQQLPLDWNENPPKNKIKGQQLTPEQERAEEERASARVSSQKAVRDLGVSGGAGGRGVRMATCAISACDGEGMSDGTDARVVGRVRFVDGATREVYEDNDGRQ